jgi:MFS family permease
MTSQVTCYISLANILFKKSNKGEKLLTDSKFTDPPLEDPPHHHDGLPHPSHMPKGILTLGMVSMLMDTSSEMIHSLLPIFMTATLGLSPLIIGIVEGVGEGVAQLIRVFSGTISDNIGRRRPFLLLGYGISTVSKPLFALATGGWVILSARVFDRIGKGIRGPPRDALVADITPTKQRGAAYGLRQSLDTAGAFLGPLLAMYFMYLWGGDVRLVFSVAIIPAAMCVALLYLRVREPKKHKRREAARGVIEWRQIRTLSNRCWWVIGIGSVASLARFSEAFIILRASEDGLSPTMIPIVLIVMNFFFLLTAYPFGHYSDRANHARLLHLGMLMLIAANVVLAASTKPLFNLIGVALWGVHLGITQGLLATMIANAAPHDLKATAFGVFGLIGGFMSLMASVIAGVLWTQLGSSFPFLASIVFASIVSVALLFYPKRNWAPH